MARLIFSIGIPGSGKTSVLKKLTAALSAAFISPDEIRVELFGDAEDHSDDQKVWEIARSRIAENLKKSRTVVFDSTFSNRDRRQIFIQEGKNSGATSIEGIYFDIPLDEILRRNSSRKKVVSEDHLHTSYERLQNDPPQIDDGFDTLIRVDANGTYTNLTPQSSSQLLDSLRAIQ